MAFRTGAYATIWEVKEGKGKYTDVRLSTSRKNQSGEYETDFSGFVRFIGDANTNASNLKEKDRIRLGDVSVTNSYDREKKITYTNFQVYSFETADGSKPDKQTTQKKETFNPDVPEGVDEELPFA